MNFRVWLKVNAADKALAPLRNNIITLFGEGDTVIDIGCGSGDLLFKSASKIRSGYGVDLDRAMIEYALKKKQLEFISNLQFECLDAAELKAKEYDVATCTLCLHELTEDRACRVLQTMSEVSSRIIIADYWRPISMLAKIGIEFDEMISGHYCRFRQYRKVGGIPEYAQKCGLDVIQSMDSGIDGITIWDLQSTISKYT